MKPVLIIGAGWAGIAAALTLRASQIPFRVFEAAPSPGGRARSLPWQGQVLDNGQHLLIGAYHETLRLLAQIGWQENEVLLRQPLTLTVRGERDSLELRAPALPAPLHLAAALLSAGTLPWSERVAALRMALRLQLSGYRLAQDISVRALLQQQRQGKKISRLLWEPLCIATLNTLPERASGQVFLNVLRDSFGQAAGDSQLLLPKVGLGEMFCERAMRYLNQGQPDSVILRQRVEALLVKDNTLRGLRVNGTQIDTEQLILATAPEAAARLCGEVPALQLLAAQITQLGSQPIVTAYLQYPPACRIPQVMLGLDGGIGQWLTDRRIAGQAGLIAVSISAEGPHMALDNTQLCTRLHAEIGQHFPDWPEPEQCQVIREKRATFDCRVGIQALRPANQTPLPGLWLAGDYTAGDYPATLEGAVRSGVQCAQQIIDSRK
ncbi:MAG: hydroxysqualene dehydroxylase HpnE [Chromatiales bacterium]|nr:hydroxysqualene dehydroxylase HpnE [Chromatiales bacterium]